MGKQSSGGTQTTTMEPPDYIKPYLDQAARGAFGLYAGPGQMPPRQPTGGSDLFSRSGGLIGGMPGSQQPQLQDVDPFAAWTPAQFPGSQVVNFSGATDAALSGITQRAQNGSPLIDQAQQFVQNGLSQPIQSGFGGQSNPYASPVASGGGSNPYASPVGVQQVSGGAGQNPWASTENPFGGATNPYLDATFDKAFGSAMQGVESQFARGGRNIGASQPVAGDIASQLASQIYAPAYENERNRQQSFAQQQLGIGAQGFEAGQGRNLQAGMANQGAGLQSQLAGQQIGAQGFENAQSRGLQAGLAGQQIGAQGFENAQNRQLSDLTAQRQMQQGLLGYASPLAAQDYMDLAQLQGAGQMYDTQNQAQLNDQINRFNYEQNRPGMALDSLLARLSGMPGSTQTTQLPTQYRNAAGGAMGGALAGAQLGSVIPGLGTGIGALAGGLLGGLF
jgi:hypothetical protein